mmetsp:Transcript_3137/g.7336  ORF Transcript_3137/g.7336 Transcript_3137/m.7336 type:complete len:220 (-) Transcript_3137:3427-4086(-)
MEETMPDGPAGGSKDRDRRRDSSPAPDSGSAGGSGCFATASDWPGFSGPADPLPEALPAPPRPRPRLAAPSASAAGPDGWLTATAETVRTGGAPVPQVTFFTSSLIKSPDALPDCRGWEKSSWPLLVPRVLRTAGALAAALDETLAFRPWDASAWACASFSSSASSSSRASLKACRSVSHICSTVVALSTLSSSAFTSCCFLISSTFSKVRLQRFMPSR